MAEREPIFNVPGVVLAVLAVFALVHAARQFVDSETAIWLLIAAAFIPARYSGEAAFIPGGEIASITSFITHIFTHADLMHLAINSAWLLAFGSVLAKRIGGWRFMAFTLCGGIAGALAFLAVHPGLAVPVVGASGAIAAQMAAVLRFLFVALDRREGYLLREAPAEIPLMSVAQSLTDRRVLAATVAFIAINLLAMFGVGLVGGEQGEPSGGIAWEAHLGGFAFGLLCFGLFDFATQNRPPAQPYFE